ncbi:anaerobic C4-dicarboxylate transporter family protein [Dermatophilus congolensis]|uniref:anaerobic C4-dicarboxylate transporter family protein n=1 Tax=Dermatophilus congolensis TaxID=1863 RepID=UPI001AAF946B|nr:anaerobic C4-dicarboxylate transporter family protein [Dermatophilus congolensis]MBO3141931.1 anaerobic C4-dicarboxylate transporter [Dermatophilus congolensis]MBO3150926.1 anaerobic C4-dicarboxylate transporter [Dermatophilus congolensis]MBO3162070.1 anaerobic C4-dicarboxylate transporter [Dermatophilus congolensis]MBO3162205.1 anaerobic C4-dicarboxylate transporter [Dermatophilus congolensis]MBO3175761.1 anaerobic C4-dicarboxylate transporter [Dermatophilus congolensis]
MIWFHLLIALLFIVIGARLGGIGIGLAGGAGVVILVATGLHTTATKDVPWSVIGIIMPVICTVAAMQLAGGIDHLVHLTEVLLRKHPKHITYLAPFVTYMLSLLCGTGHTAYSVIPVIVDVAKEHKIRPSRPLAIAVVASQVAVAASPISAAMVALAVALTPLNVGYLQCLAIVIPTTFIGCMIGAFVSSRQGCELEDDPIYKERLAQGLIRKNAANTTHTYKPAPSAVPSLIIFLIALILVVTYATVTSKQLGLIAHAPIDSTSAIMAIMLAAAALICVVAKQPTKLIATQNTFSSGMTAAICIMGLAWLGNVFVGNYMEEIKAALAGPLQAQPWLAAVFFYFAAPLMFSHAATTTAFMPLLVNLKLPAIALLASYPAVANYYLLPNYPTTVAAMEMDDTGSTRVGKFVLDHPFVLPGTVAILVTVILGFITAPLVA